MRYCSRCGVPRILTNEHSWGSNGTLYLRNDPTHRMVIIDMDALNHILDSIAECIGLPVDNIILEAKRRSGQHFMDAILSGIKGLVARNLISAKVYQQLAKQVSMLGYGHAEVVGYRRHSYLEGLVSDAYNAPAISGDIGGAFNSVERRFADIDYVQEEAGLLRITISASGESGAEYSDRFTFNPPPALPGHNIFELCPVCRAPLELGKQYSFDMERGVIHELKTGHRVVLVGMMTLRNLFGELEAELGEEIPSLIMSIEKDRVREVILEKGKELDTSEEGYLRYTRTMELKGMGNGERAEFSGDTVVIRVDNPYYEPLVAGFLAGFYEATNGTESKVDWIDSKASYTEVTISPA